MAFARRQLARFIRRLLRAARRETPDWRARAQRLRELLGEAPPRPRETRPEQKQ